jgi:two-component system sensor histidine kinase/response regulator
MEKILVIEDAYLLRNDIIETLDLEGFEVIGAENGLVGVQMAREHRPDLIICDIMMPELDGYEVLEELRKDPHLAVIPFIFMTARTDKTDIRLGMGLGADDYLTKPFLTADLLKSIRARLGKIGLTKKQAEMQLNELRENIITALPHELRTPLNTIIGFSEMLVTEYERLDPGQIKTWGEHINSAALRLFHLIENYLVYVRVETMSHDPEKIKALQQNSSGHPGAIIQLQASQKAQQTQRESDLVLAIEEVDAIAISEQDLGKIVEELVDNAFKFSSPGTEVRVEAGLDNAMYRLRVTNQGRGMTSEQITAIGAYMQFDRWLVEQQGMGLGLTISKRLAELSGGSLEIESVPDGETTVSVRFVLASA